jgi:DNA-directed RNA polymerase I subunit RPA2
MKTTTVRKLLPESWGFLCPVHTPDGGPCGLLNHLALNSLPQSLDVYNPEIHPNLEKLCINRGMISINGLNYI